MIYVSDEIKRSKLMRKLFLLLFIIGLVAQLQILVTKR